jgi:hypothetical protein
MGVEQEQLDGTGTPTPCVTLASDRGCTAARRGRGDPASWFVLFPSSNQRPAPANQSSKLAVHQRGPVSGLSAHGQCRVPWSVTALPSSFFTLIPSRSNPLPSVSSGVFRNPES